MFDSRKIDDFFNDEKSFLREEKSDKPPVSRWLRFIKLGFPCFAALLLGVMVVMPNIKKSVDLKDNITVPRKSEMEKLHMEQTVFHFTDEKNRVSHVVADMIDETEPGSQRMKIIQPKGKIPTDQGEADITSEIGFFSQESSILELYENVKALVNQDTQIKTQSARYDFKQNIGYGDEKIEAQGSWGNLTADAFEYDQQEAILTLIGNSFVSTSKGTLSAKDKSVFFQNNHIIKAYGNVVLTQNNTRLKADEIIAYMNEKDNHKIDRAEAYGNVYIITPEQTARGACGVYDAAQNRIVLENVCKNPKYASVSAVEVKQEQNTLTARRMVAYLVAGEKQQLDRVEAYGGVHVVTPKGTATGDTGYYRPKENVVELIGNVVIEQNGNFIRGGRAETDLQTSISKITGFKKGERISGIFYNKRKANNSNATE